MFKLALMLTALASASAQTPTPISIFIQIEQDGHSVSKLVKLDGFYLTSDPLGNLTLSASPPQKPVDLGPEVTIIDASTISIGRNCSIAEPCKAAVKGVVHEYVASSTVTYTGDVTLRFYISDGSDNNPPGTWIVAREGTGTATCDEHCVVRDSGAFAGLQLAQANFSVGNPPAFKDWRAALSN
jgi:hypothetical protein